MHISDAVSEGMPSSGGKVQRVSIDASEAGQRLDNYLLCRLKGVPRSHIYKLLRSGQVRVNGGRAKPLYKLCAGDEVRLPPVRLSQTGDTAPVSGYLADTLKQSILFEDEALIVLNKPAGMAVHGGSGVAVGVIEAMREILPDEKRLELVHRLDRETSGCLVLARSRAGLVQMQKDWRGTDVQKIYQALCVGKWPRQVREVDVPLERGKGGGGERRVRAGQDGKSACTRFQVLERYPQATLMEARLASGRTHQIRVHAQWVGHPLAGDTKYGRREDNSYFRSLELKRMFLHAASVVFRHPISGDMVTVDAPLAVDLQSVLDRLGQQR